MNTKKQPLKERGQGLVEYALIMIGMISSVILILNITGTSLTAVYCQVVSNLGGSGCGFTSTFEEANAQEDWECWKKEDYMAIEGGKACVSPSKETYLNRCSIDFGPADFTMDLKDVSIDKSKGKNPEFHAVFRAQDEKNGYYFSYNVKSNNVRFWKIVEGKRITLEKARVPRDWRDQELDFQIRVEGDNFTALKDGEQILTAQDDAYREGQYGFRNRKSPKICLGEITVQQLPQNK